MAGTNPKRFAWSTCVWCFVWLHIGKYIYFYYYYYYYYY